MDRRELLFAAALALAAVLVSGGLAYADAVALPFQEGFEDTDDGSYPDPTRWSTLSAGTDAYVTKLNHFTGEKSFRLDTWPFSPQMDYVVLAELPDRLSYEAAVCLDKTSGWIGLVGFMDHYNGNFPMWNFFCVCVDGVACSISFCAGEGEERVDCGSYTRGDWCKVRADLNYQSGTAKLWVNDSAVPGAEAVPITAREFYYGPMGDVVTDQWGVASDTCSAFSNIVYFDDLCVWELSTTITVDIDVKPGRSPNPINIGAKGVLPVCVFSSDSFDATQIDPSSCDLAGAPVAVRGNGTEQPLVNPKDVDGDGLLDLLMHFETEELDIHELWDGWAVLTGATVEGDEFIGMDEVVLLARPFPMRGRR